MSGLTDTNTTTDSDRAEVVITDETEGTHAKVSDDGGINVANYILESYMKDMISELKKLNRYMEMISGG